MIYTIIVFLGTAFPAAINVDHLVYVCDTSAHTIPRHYNHRIAKYTIIYTTNDLQTLQKYENEQLELKKFEPDWESK